MTATKIALVTGGSRGLGKDMALSIASKGIDVIITYKSNAADADDTVRKIHEIGRKAAALSLDMTQPGQLDPFVAGLSKLLSSAFATHKFDFLINNAGMGATIPFPDVTEKIFDDFLNVHYKGVYFLIQKCLTLLNDNGAIINKSSGSTRFAVPGYSVYASMKGAIEVLTRYLAKELGSCGIRVNVVAPGPIETDFNSGAIRNNPQMKGFLSSMTPLGRVGYADDIGGVVAFLCTPEAKWINGQRIEVSGGINM
jgi:NAD(P)-dependent dehydrogenase (short-subunit alcohol dehydrogenase family)